MQRLPPALLPALALLALAPRPVQAQSLSTGDAETEASITLIPELGGAATFDLRLSALLTPFGGGSLRSLPTTGLDAAAGYRHFFDIHGALALATRLRGGASLSGEPAGAFRHLGVEVGLEFRGYTEHFFFGEGGLVLSADALFLDTAVLGDEASTAVGWRAGVGLETGLGSLIWIDPYLFLGTGALVELTWIDIPDAAEGLALTVNWVVRFDWAWRESWLPVDRPDEDAVDDVYRVLPPSTP